MSAQASCRPPPRRCSCRGSPSWVSRWRSRCRRASRVRSPWRRRPSSPRSSCPRQWCDRLSCFVLLCSGCLPAAVFCAVACFFCLKPPRFDSACPPHVCSLFSFLLCIWFAGRQAVAAQIALGAGAARAVPTGARGVLCCVGRSSLVPVGRVFPPLCFAGVLPRSPMCSTVHVSALSALPRCISVLSPVVFAPDSAPLLSPFVRLCRAPRWTTRPAATRSSKGSTRGGA